MQNVQAIIFDMGRVLVHWEISRGLWKLLGDLLGNGESERQRAFSRLYDPARRYFWMEATRGGLPVDGLHAYSETDASMRIRLLSLVPVVRVDGPQMMRGETVTLLNDACLFAPGSLPDLPIRWRELDAQSVEATYTNGPHTVRAVLVFDESGALVDFRSDDRPALAEDGKTLLPQNWSTPIRGYRPMGPYRLAASGEARYAAPTGEYAYIELEVNEVSTEVVPYNRGGR